MDALHVSRPPTSTVRAHCTAIGNDRVPQSPVSGRRCVDARNIVPGAYTPVLAKHSKSFSPAAFGSASAGLQRDFEPVREQIDLAVSECSLEQVAHSTRYSRRCRPVCAGRASQRARRHPAKQRRTLKRSFSWMLPEQPRNRQVKHGILTKCEFMTLCLSLVDSGRSPPRTYAWV